MSVRVAFSFSLFAMVGGCMCFSIGRFFVAGSMLHQLVVVVERVRVDLDRLQSDQPSQPSLQSQMVLFQFWLVQFIFD